MDVIKNLLKYMEKEGKVELSDEFKTKLTEAFDIVKKENDTEILGLKDVLKEAKEEIEALVEKESALKESILTDVKTEVEEYKEGLVEKVSSFFEKEMAELVPTELVEAQAKLEIFEPLIEKVQGVFSGFGVELKSEAQDVLKEAKSTIIEQKEAFDKLYAEHQTLEEKAGQLLAKFTLREKCEGMTNEQSEKMSTLFEGASVEEIEAKFDSMSELVIGESSNVADIDANVDVDVDAGLVNEDVDTDGLITEDNEDLGQKHI